MTFENGAGEEASRGERKGALRAAASTDAEGRERGSQGR